MGPVRLDRADRARRPDMARERLRRDRMRSPDWHEFASREELAEALASVVADVLRAAIDKRGTTLLAVSGGNTPGMFFRELSQQELDWDNVTVTLVDERFVPEDSSRSNARLVRENLLQDKAAAARFAGLFSDANTVENAADRAGERL